MIPGANGARVNFAILADPYTEGLLASLDALGGVPIQGSRLKTIKGSTAFTGTTYAATDCVGGLVTVATGLGAGMKAQLTRLTVAIASASVTTPQSLLVYLFDTAPGGSSTFTDTSAVVLAAADVASLIANGTAAIVSQASGGADAWALSPASAPVGLTLDATGDFYFAIAAAATNLVFGAAASLYWRAELKY